MTESDHYPGEIIYGVARYGDAVYSRRCHKCGRFTKPHPTAIVNDVVGAGPAYGTCAVCGDVRLEFVGWEDEV